MIVRPLLPADLPQVERIERDAAPSSWSEAQVREEIGAANGFALVAASGDTVYGYAFFRTCFPESELVHLAVAPERRRRKVATSLLAQAMAGLADQGYTTCYLEVRKSNIAARQLYARAGFVQVGTRKQYYSQPVEDALLLTREIPSAQEEHK